MWSSSETSAQAGMRAVASGRRRRYRAVLGIVAATALALAPSAANAQDAGSGGWVTLTVNQLFGHITVNAQAEVGYNTSNARIWVSEDHSTKECTSPEEFAASSTDGYWLAGDEDSGEIVDGNSYDETWHFKPGTGPSKRGAWRVCAFLEWDGEMTSGEPPRTYSSSFSDGDTGWFYVTRPCRGSASRVIGPQKTGQFVRVSVVGVSDASCGFARARAKRVLNAWPRLTSGPDNGWAWWPPYDDSLTPVYGPVEAPGSGKRKVLYERLGFDIGAFQDYSDEDFRFVELSVFHELAAAHFPSR